MDRGRALSKRRVISLTAGAVLATASGCDSGSHARTSDQLLFSSGGVDTRIQVIGADGGGRRELTRHPPGGVEPTWVMRGSALTFNGPDGRLWLMRSNGTGAHRLPVGYYFSQLSPDGRRIATLTDGGSLLVTTTSGRKLRRIGLPLGRYDVFNTPASWSPTGRFVALEVYSGDLEHSRILRVDIAKTAVRSLSASRSADNSPVWSPDGTKIAFEVARSSSVGDLYVMKSDGSGRVRLAKRSVAAPAWSPDGRHLVFQRETGRALSARRWTTVAVIPSTGGRERFVARVRGSVANSTWAPDSNHIAFADTTGVRVAEIGARARRVTRLGAGSYLSWAPGRTIVFSDRDAIWSIDAGGRAVSTLARVLNDVSPVWSPTGDRIVFVRGPYRQGREPVRASVWVVAANGAGARRIGDGYAPSWSPDGRRLVYSARVDGRNAVVVQTVGAGTRRTVAYGSAPSWSPAGSTIAFLVTTHDEVHVVGADGTPARVLLGRSHYGEVAASERYSFHPVWSPDGLAVAVATDLEDFDGTSYGEYIRVVTLTGRIWKVQIPAPTELAWSPDGKWIVGTTNHAVRVARADGKKAPQIVAHGDDESFRDATWAPDGTQIAYTHCYSTRSLVCWLETAHPDGSHRRQLVRLNLPGTIGDNPPLGPAWRPKNR